MIVVMKEERFKMLLLWYPKCSTCQKAKKFLDDNNVVYEQRDITIDNPTANELEAWHELSGLNIKKFFNTSGLVYRALELKDKLESMTYVEKLEILATDGKLVKRPLLVDEKFVLVGFKVKEWEDKIINS